MLVNTRRDSLIDPYRTYLHQRWNDGCTDATVLHTEIRAQGFTGSDQTVRRYVRPFRATVTAPPVAAQPPKTRHVARWIMTDPDNLNPDDADQLQAILRRSPKIAALAGHVRDFATIMRKRAGTSDLPQWIERADTDELPGLRSSINGIRADLPAVTNGLSLPYSSGPSKDTSTASKRSSAKCTAELTSTSSANASSRQSDRPITESVPEPNYVIADTRPSSRYHRNQRCTAWRDTPNASATSVTGTPA